jgi:hypothetical protein
MTRFCSQILHFDMVKQGRRLLKILGLKISLLVELDGVVMEVEGATSFGKLFSSLA